MCKILLSINPKYSSQILQGTKKYEYRRQIAKRTVDEILIYSTAPDMKILGSVKVHSILKGTPAELWEKTSMYAGICKEKFFSYFEDRKNAFAYKLGDVQLFNPPKKLEDYNIKFAPQSFIYL
ncbi:ASCH domain-containing protein [Treponema pectinovorum]|uniref:ASCH domain-containing protein n=1 Tax=Treponema pectinovorum TaxID=164 RepID=UPI0011C7D033|nr:ASCH domain-containing protein [Treponema pectinovorum]